MNLQLLMLLLRYVSGAAAAAAAAAVDVPLDAAADGVSPMLQVPASALRSLAHCCCCCCCFCCYQLTEGFPFESEDMSSQSLFLFCFS